MYGVLGLCGGDFGAGRRARVDLRGLRMGCIAGRRIRRFSHEHRLSMVFGKLP